MYRKSFLYLILILVLVSVAVVGLTIRILYKTAISVQQNQLIESAHSQAGLIEANILQQEKIHPDPNIAMESTLNEIVDFHQNYKGFGQTGEFILGILEDGNISILLSRHYPNDVRLRHISLDSKMAEPLRRALSGESGSMIGLDYRGERVLAAYEPIAESHWGIVVKLDLKEIRSPFVKAGLTAADSPCWLFFWAPFALLSSAIRSSIAWKPSRLIWKIC